MGGTATSGGAACWSRLRGELHAIGLHVLRPVTQASLDRLGVDVSLSAWLPGAGSALVVGDGGRAFFARFEREGDPELGAPDPLDRYTARVVAAAVARALDGTEVGHRVLHPFRAAPDEPFLPFQRIGLASGLPGPGPLALQVHPEYGPWWAYRALVLLTATLEEQAPLPSLCQACAAPCRSACPAGAVGPFDVAACSGRRAADVRCRASCAARSACVIAPEHRYPEHQLAFHMGASFAMLRRR